jgi:acylphosphatase
MDTFMQRCYNIMISGKVQDIGFRSLIEDIARLYDMRGFAFNDTDGSVKMVCCGENGAIANFLEELKTRGAQKGAVIEHIASKEIPFEIYLPQRFLRLYTDELADIGRKLDIGNDELKKINTKLAGVDEKLYSIDEKLYSISDGVNNLNTTMGSFVSEQRDHNQWMKEHNQRLEKILEKLAGR